MMKTPADSKLLATGTGVVLVLLGLLMWAAWSLAAGPADRPPAKAALSDEGDGGQAAIEAILKIKQIASESKKQEAGIEQLLVVARGAKSPAARKAAVGAAADLYVELGRQEEAMRILANLAAGEGPQRPSADGNGKGPLKFEKVAALHDSHFCGVTADFGGKVYVCAGLTKPAQGRGDRSTGLEIYDPATGRWSRGKDIPLGRSSGGFFVLDRRLYCVGGESSPGSFVRSVARYDFAGNTWEGLHDAPVVMWDPVVAVCDGKAYLMGGRRGYGATQAEVYVYDPQDDSWAKKAPMPHSVMCAGAIAVGGKIHVFSGTHGDSESQRDPSDLHQVYDPAKDSWETRTLPFKYHNLWAVQAGPYVWVFPRQELRDNKFVDPRVAHRYDPATEQWRTFALESPESFRVDNRPVVVGGKAYFTSQLKGEQYGLDVWSLDLPGAAEGAAHQ